jgi:hypothetical protein
VVSFSRGGVDRTIIGIKTKAIPVTGLGGL